MSINKLIITYDCDKNVYMLDMYLTFHMYGLDDNALSYINTILSEYEYRNNQF